MEQDTSVIVRPARNLAGTLRLPGDKSISHRYAMLAAIAEGSSRLQNFSTGADCASTLGCLRGLGCQWKRRQEGEIVVEVQGRGARLLAPATALDCGNSGSTLRMLAGILAGQDFTTQMVGDESLSRRPMERIITPLTAMGAAISSAPGQRPPLRIRGGGLHGISYRMPVASAQVKSAILFAGLLAEGETSVQEPFPTRDHGELALRACGARLSQNGSLTSIAGKQRLRGIEARIAGDISTAAFFLCAAAILPESDLVLEGVLMNPTRTAILDLLLEMGARISVVHLEQQHGELVGTLQVRAGALRGATLAGARSAALIDELPVLAAIAPYTEGGIEIRDAGELRVKESDRIAAVAANLRAMGAVVEEREDGLGIAGGQRLRGGEVDSFGDHRIAMAFAVAALRAQGETILRGAQAASISYPDFFPTLERLVER